MTAVASLIPIPLSWPASILVLVFTVAAAVLVQIVVSRPSFPRDAPRSHKGWPVLGSIDFFRARSTFLGANTKGAPSGQFSFYYGPHNIVALSGPEARTAYFNTRSLDLNKGFSTLLAAAPNIGFMYKGDFTNSFITIIKRMLHKERLMANLDRMTADAEAALANLDAPAAIDPFAVMPKLIYQFTHRTLGSNDVADNPKLLAETLALYGRLDASSALEVMFPLVPWPSKLQKVWAGAKLHWTFSKIVRERRRTGRKDTDAMQWLMDQDYPEIFISVFIIASLFAGLINSTFMAAWILCHLAENPEWYARVQAEVDQVVAKHRQDPDEPVAKVIARIPLETWESGLPEIDLAMRETIRYSSLGVSMRKNVGDKDIRIGDTGEVIPGNAFAVYDMSDVHMNEQIYKNPTVWDPERYLPGREEDKKQPHAYLGWGTGLHPCLGMRFAKLEMVVSTVTFCSLYDFERSDEQGNKPRDSFPTIDRTSAIEKQPIRNIYLKCRRRV